MIPEVARFCPHPLDGTLVSELWMLNKQIELELQTALFHDVLICDRSVYDMVAYANVQAKNPDEKELIRLIAKAWGNFRPYTAIFYLSPLTLEDDGVRTTDPNFQKAVDIELKTILAELELKNTALYWIDGNKEQRCCKVFKIIWRMIKMSKKSKVCIHIGHTHPNQFSCIDCEDTADKCNCHDCMGVFCDRCKDFAWIEKRNKVVMAECQDVVDMWDETQQGFADEKKDCTEYDNCKIIDGTKEPLDCDACGYYTTTGMY